MDFSTFIVTYYKYIISAAVSAVFLIVNIIQFFRTRNKNKLKEAICRIPEIIRCVEVMYPDLAGIMPDGSTTTPTRKSLVKKASAEALLKSEFGEKFVNKYIGVLDECIEDVLNTPSKKGGTYVQKEDETR